MELLHIRLFGLSVDPLAGCSVYSYFFESETRRSRAVVLLRLVRHVRRNLGCRLRCGHGGLGRRGYRRDRPRLCGHNAWRNRSLWIADQAQPKCDGGSRQYPESFYPVGPSRAAPKGRFASARVKRRWSK